MATDSSVSRDSARILRGDRRVARSVVVYRQALELIRDGRKVSPDLLSAAREEVSRYAYAALLKGGIDELEAAAFAAEFVDRVIGPDF